MRPLESSGSASTGVDPFEQMGSVGEKKAAAFDKIKIGHSKSINKGKHGARHKGHEHAHSENSSALEVSVGHWPRYWCLLCDKQDPSDLTISIEVQRFQTQNDNIDEHKCSDPNSWKTPGDIFSIECEDYMEKKCCAQCASEFELSEEPEDVVDAYCKSYKDTDSYEDGEDEDEDEDEDE